MAMTNENETQDAGLPATQTNVPVAIGSSGAEIRSFDELKRFGAMVLASGFAPKGIDRVESVCAAIQMGFEVGLAPMQAVQNIAVINGRPSIYGDAAKALVEASGLCEEFTESFEGKEGTDGYKAVCEVKRYGRAVPVRQTFSMADAKLAKLVTKDGPWKQYPRRMLQMRARGFAVRDAFPDVLKGLALQEEARDIIDVTPSEPKPGTVGELEEKLGADKAPNPEFRRPVELDGDPTDFHSDEPYGDEHPPEDPEDTTTGAQTEIIGGGRYA